MDDSWQSISRKQESGYNGPVHPFGYEQVVSDLVKTPVILSIMAEVIPGIPLKVAESAPNSLQFSVGRAWRVA